MASNRVKTRELKSGEIVAYSESAIRNNASAVEYCRTSMAALSGSTAGEIFGSASIRTYSKKQFQNNNTNVCVCIQFRRYYGTDGYTRILVLFGCRARTMVFAVTEIWLKLAKILYQP